MVNIRLIDNPEWWELFVKKQPYTLFVQSFQYGEFYRAMGEKYWIIGIFDDNELIGGALALTTHAKRGNFLYIPYGPILKKGGESGMEPLTEFLVDLAKKEGLHFIRISPFWEEGSERRLLLVQHGFRKAPMHALAETTWLLDITPEEETLLANMNKNHRNLIRRCMREGVVVRLSNEAAALDRFNRLHDETAKRHRFHRFSKNYVSKEFHAFADLGMAMIFEAYLPDGTLDASAIIIFYGSMAAYRHGASLGKDRRIPTSYLLQWEAIREARRRGMRWYNFWGIAPKGARLTHPFYGMTHFKTGFGGKQLDLVPCHDLPVSRAYWLAWTLESIRRVARGFSS